MTLVAAAVCPGTPLLAPEVSVRDGGVAGVRNASLEAVGALVASAPTVVVVLGDAATTGERQGTWDWHPFGVARRGEAGPALPRSLGIGAWLLDQARWAGPRRFVGVCPQETGEHCATLGVGLARSAARVALLVVADGSARRDVKAPGSLDDQAQDYDDGVARALADADVGALTRLDPGLSQELMVAGRAGWQVLAGAAAGCWTADLLAHQAPYGVGWFVALWRRP